MKLLVINHYAGSDRMGMEYRPFYLAREWVAAGNSAVVLAADYSHLRACQPMVRSDLECTEEQGVRFRWLRTNSYAGNGLKRVANMLAFAGKLYAHANRISREERPDVVICSSTYPLDIYPGARIARRSGARLVFEVHDLWPLTPMLLGGYSENSPYIRVLQRAEDWAYANADVVVSILPNAREYMVSRGLDPQKFVHIPNGIQFTSPRAVEEGELPRAVQLRIGEERRRGRFLVGYAGGIAVSNAIGTLLGAARILASRGVTFLLAGSGAEAGHLRAEATRFRLDNFHMLGPIPKTAVQAFLSRMDALAIAWCRSPLYRFGVSPNKVFDYMVAGKPILQASDASNDLVAEANCGITVPPEDPEEFANAVIRLRAFPTAKQTRLGMNGRRFVQRHHDYRILASRFIEAVASAPATSGSHHARRGGGRCRGSFEPGDRDKGSARSSSAHRESLISSDRAAIGILTRKSRSEY
jgi:glycosyltransferase involved in cell wall biosynthesis